MLYSLYCTLCTAILYLHIIYACQKSMGDDNINFNVACCFPWSRTRILHIPFYKIYNCSQRYILGKTHSLHSFLAFTVRKLKMQVLSTAILTEKSNFESYNSLFGVGDVLLAGSQLIFDKWRTKNKKCLTTPSFNHSFW